MINLGKQIAAFFSVSSFIGLVVGLVFIFFPDWAGNHKLFIFILSLHWLLIFELIYQLYQQHLALKNTALFSPKIVKVYPERNQLLTKECSWLAHFTSVAIYKIDDEYEELIAYGYVINLQKNKCVNISYVLVNESESINLMGIREKILIRPGVKDV